MAFDFRKFIKGIRLIADAGTTATSSKGDLDVTTDGKLNYHNGTSASPVVTQAHAAQGVNRLKNKDLEDSSIAVVDATDTTKQIKFDAAGTTSTSTTITSSQTANRVLTLPDATDTLVGETKSATLTNKTIAAGSNTISGLTNSNLSGSAAISNANLATMASSSTTVGTVKGNISGSSATPSDVVLTSANTSSSAVYRDSSGNFSAGTITASLSGNATNVTGTVAIANGGTGQTTKTLAFDALSPTTTKGDIIVSNGSNNTRQPVSANNGYVLAADSTSSTGVAWIAPGGGVPIGSIISFSGGYFTASGNGGAYTDVLGNTIVAVNSYISSYGFVVCDGTAPNDALSPIFNSSSRYVPDLTDSRFLEGANTAGLIGGQNTITLTTTELPVHDHTWSNSHAHTASGTAASDTHYHLMYNSDTSSTDTDLYLAQIRNTTTAADYNLRTSATSPTKTRTNSDTHTHTLTVTVNSASINGTTSSSGSGAAFNNRPKYFNVFYIIRIK